MSDAPNDGFRDDEDGLDLERGDLTQVLKAVEAQDAQRVFELFDPLHPADIADILEQIGAETRRALVHLYGTEFDGDILSELDENIRDEVVGYLRPEVLAEAVRDMDSDDVVDLLEDLDESQHSAILDALEAPDRDAARQALSYPEYSAGRLMQREFVAVPEDWTVGQTIDMMRTAEDLPDQFYHVFLVTPQNLPTGYVTLGRLLSSKRETALLSILEDSFRSFDLDEEEGDVAYAFNQYHLISAPVVDTDGRLVGVITIDDAMAVLDEEHEEDMLRMAGAGEGSLSDGVIETTWQRLPWLGVNLLTAIIASLVIAIFETTIETLVALAVLMPIVASMGGKCGHAIHGGGGARACHARPDRCQCLAGDPPRNRCRVFERHDLRRGHGRGRLCVVRVADAGGRDRGGHGHQPCGGGAVGHWPARAAGPSGRGPGAGFGHVRDHRDRCGGAFSPSLGWPRSCFCSRQSISRKGQGFALVAPTM